MPILLRKQLRIVLTGGGTGGHIYPLLAVADYLREVGESSVQLFYLGRPGAFQEEFEDRYMRTYGILPSKLRRYFDLRNLIDIPLFFLSILQSLFWLYFLMPDLVFSKGGPGSFAVVLAARFYRIPVVIHESDSVPSMTNLLSSRYASKILVHFPSSAPHFPKEKTIVVGHPLREALIGPWGEQEGAKAYFGFNQKEPVVLFLGGSQGAAILNSFVFTHVRDLMGEVQLLHQVGRAHEKEARGIVRILLQDLSEEERRRYVWRTYFDVKEVKLSFLAADVVVTRAGAGAIAEIAFFGKPAILVPLKAAAQDHQRSNAYEYAKTGAAIVLEEENLKPRVLVVQVKKILEDAQRMQEMERAARSFAQPDATERVGKEILSVAGITI